MWRTSVVVAPETAVGAPAPLKGPIAETVRAAARIGYDAVQVTVNRPAEFEVGAARRALRATRLTVTSIGTGQAYAVDGISLGHRSVGRRAAAVDRVRQHVALAEELGGANVVIGTIRGRYRDSTDRRRFMTDYRHSIETCLDRAERAGITLVHEAIGRGDSDVLRTVDENLAFLDGFGSAHLRLHVDTHHLDREETDWAAALHRARGRLAQVDIADVTRDGGPVDLPRLVRTLHEIDYTGYLVFEYTAAGAGAPEARAGLDHLRSVYAA